MYKRQVLGIVAGYFKDRLPDHLLRGYALLLASTPAFWIGLLLLMILSLIHIWIAIGYVITVMMSAFWGDGSYYPCVPAFVDAMGSEIRAVVVQTVLCGLVGMVYAAGSVVWEVDRWSLAGQTAAYFLITLGSVLPVAYAAYWMERSVAGVLSYVAIFCAIFAGIWISQYLGCLLYTSRCV